MKHEVSLTLPWVREGTKHFLAVVESLSDSDFRRDSRLPGWSKAHVVGHVARNAEALARLATWARTGVETPMYADRSQRVAEIEESAVLPPPELRAFLVDSAERLDSELDRLAPEGWTAQVRSALGRTIPAAEVPWMRIREVWLHAADLGDDTVFDEIPDRVVDLLLDDVCANLSGKDGCPPVTVAPVDRHTSWRLGAGDPGATARGRAAELVGWVTGRVPRPDLPPLPGWL
ncbi:maleylpyruvate isomerase family mycothiol-dependent enzyme [Amycolatopsis balhimycina DSM 5908]|uniref:Maleylpyruvate isomerase family mycothiol-dependent enzyme n=1 Tax=Amycolatopsis balhimycina DSM 5908 TaxID=1081091 RepID=A0A428WMG9_AMYBA|nr:maleylpyruvate isomerase family mycothiol-dependent enzyme [Amycolatopsis balhimycina]RSM44200.1 maleylpyruvate isomerase family mycothiol-dependent enzyme [Amycolatopsis balhimycina DSM 5908]